MPDCDWLICGSKEFRADIERRLHENGIAPKRIHVEAFKPFSDTTPATELTQPQPLKRPQQHKLTNYSVLAGVAVFVAQALAGVKWPLLDQLQSKTAYSALTGTILLLLIVMQWRLSYMRMRYGAPSSARAYHLHIASGPAVLGMIWLHSTGLGYGLSMSVCLGFLGSLATGALLSAYPRSPSCSPFWERARRILLASHVAFSCAGSGLVLLHGFSALWY